MDVRPELTTSAIEASRSSAPKAAWQRPSIDEKLDQSLEQTFPASDPFEISA